MSGIRVRVKKTSQSAQTLKLMAQWEQRAQHVVPMMAWIGADYVRRFVQSKLPKGGSTSAYRHSLEVAKVKGARGVSAYVVHVNMQSRWVKRVKTNKVLLYIQPKRTRVAAVDPQVKVLARYNPWTYESLPFQPDGSVATIKTQSARPTQVYATTKKRQADRKKWARDLAKVGYRDIDKSNRIQIPKSMSMLPDVALDALRLEFGMGVKPRPTWRLGISMLRRAGLRAISRDRKHFLNPFAKLSDTMWRKFPIRTRSSISSVSAKKYAGFEKRLGLRGNR